MRLRYEAEKSEWAVGPPAQWLWCGFVGGRVGLVGAFYIVISGEIGDYDSPAAVFRQHVEKNKGVDFFVAEVAGIADELIQNAITNIREEIMFVVLVVVLASLHGASGYVSAGIVVFQHALFPVVEDGPLVARAAKHGAPIDAEASYSRMGAGGGIEHIHGVTPGPFGTLAANLEFMGRRALRHAGQTAENDYERIDAFHDFHAVLVE